MHVYKNIQRLYIIPLLLPSSKNQIPSKRHLSLVSLLQLRLFMYAFIYVGMCYVCMWYVGMCVCRYVICMCILYLIIPIPRTYASSVLLSKKPLGTVFCKCSSVLSALLVVDSFILAVVVVVVVEVARD